MSKPSSRTESYPLVADFDDRAIPLTNGGAPQKLPVLVPSCTAIRASLLQGRLTWTEGEHLLIKHCGGPDAFLPEMDRILEVLEGIRLRRELSSKEQKLLDDILDTEWALLPELGAK